MVVRTPISKAGRSPAGDAPSGSDAPTVRDVRRVLGLHVTLSVVLATRDMTVDSILGLSIGSIIEFDVPFDADLAVSIGNQEVGRGSAVKFGENFGIRFSTLGNMKDRIGAMKGAT